jgi:hypothetical protein
MHDRVSRIPTSKKGGLTGFPHDIGLYVNYKLKNTLCHGGSNQIPSPPPTVLGVGEGILLHYQTEQEFAAKIICLSISTVVILGSVFLHSFFAIFRHSFRLILSITLCLFFFLSAIPLFFLIQYLHQLCLLHSLSHLFRLRRHYASFSISAL